MENPDFKCLDENCTRRYKPVTASHIHVNKITQQQAPATILLCNEVKCYNNGESVNLPHKHTHNIVLESRVNVDVFEPVSDRGTFSCRNIFCEQFKKNVEYGHRCTSYHNFVVRK